MPSVDYENRAKSYVYGIDPRGRQFTDLMGLTDHVLAKGVSFMGAQVGVGSVNDMLVSAASVTGWCRQSLGWCRQPL